METDAVIKDAFFSGPDGGVISGFLELISIASRSLVTKKVGRNGLRKRFQKPRTIPWTIVGWGLRTVKKQKYSKRVNLTNGLFPPIELDKATDKNGVPYVPPAFIPSDDVAKCWSCDRRRTLLVIHCEHCDAPLPGFAGCPRTPADNVARHGALCFCPECREKKNKDVDDWLTNPNRREEQEMAREKAEHVERDFSKSKAAQSGGSSFGNSRQFLKAKDLPPKGKVVSVRVDGFRDAPRNMQYSQFLVDVTMNGRGYTIGIKDEEDQKLANMIAVLGPKTKTWPGKMIRLHNDVWNSPTGKTLVLRVMGKK